MNPWVSLWLEPNATLRHLMDSGSERWVFPLATAGYLGQMATPGIIAEFEGTFAIASLLGAAIACAMLSAVCVLYLGAPLLRWTGGWIGGEGSVKQIRIAIGWASLPVAASFWLWIPISLTTYTMQNTEAARDAPLAWVGLGVVILLMLGFLVLYLWSIVIFVKGLAIAQGFTVFYALLNGFLVYLIVGVAMFGLLILFFLLGPLLFGFTTLIWGHMLLL